MPDTDPIARLVADAFECDHVVTQRKPLVGWAICRPCADKLARDVYKLAKEQSDE